MDEKIMEFSYMLADILDLFHKANVVQNKEIFRQLYDKTLELHKYTDEVIAIIEKQSYKENQALNSLTILLPLIEMIKRVNIQKESLFIRDYPEAILSFKNSFLRFSDLVWALKLYLIDKGKFSISHYLTTENRPILFH